MAQIIFDISANTHKNDYDYYIKMMDELAKVNTGKHEIILKWQLFKASMTNIVANKNLFRELAEWCWYNWGLKTTASIFDVESLEWLLKVDDGVPYSLPFIKIACNPDYYWLVDKIPRKYEVYISRYSKYFTNHKDYIFHYDPYEDNIIQLECVPLYPAYITQYTNAIYISDHTIGLDLWYRNKPIIWEKHFKLPDSTGFDAGDWAITPEELSEIL